MKQLLKNTLSLILHNRHWIASFTGLTGSDKLVENEEAHDITGEDFNEVVLNALVIWGAKVANTEISVNPPRSNWFGLIINEISPDSEGSNEGYIDADIYTVNGNLNIAECFDSDSNVIQIGLANSAYELYPFELKQIINLFDCDIGEFTSCIAPAITSELQSHVNKCIKKVA